MDHIAVRLSDGITIAVPASLSCVSTYVLLEQEAWFEKECAFVRRYLKPGMNVIDIGANIGVYSLPMAMQVAPGGRVIAYEPASEPRRLLEISRQFNQANNLEVVAAAVSDGERQGHLALGSSSEYNSLGGTGPGEDVRITSLDLEEVTRSLQSPDFVKIDAEGEEERILAGGRAFFDRHSPLVMFENSDTRFSANLRDAFAHIGYESYRALQGEPILVRIDPQTLLDKFELNLFAAKPDLGRRLAADGLAVDRLPSWRPDANARVAGLACLKAKPFSGPLAVVMNFDAKHDPVYLDGLAGYAQWQDRAQPLTQRCGALAFAYIALQHLCRRAPSVARLSTLARCAWDWGSRTDSVAALRQLAMMAEQGAPPPAEPFWPACARFDDIVPPARHGQSWFLSAAVEQLERSCSLSSAFAGEPSLSPRVAWLCSQPFASAEMERRRFLQAARARRPIEVPPRLRTEAPDHHNAALWRQAEVMAAL